MCGGTVTGNQVAPYVPSTSFKKYSKSSTEAEEAELNEDLTDSPGGGKRCGLHPTCHHTVVVAL